MSKCASCGTPAANAQRFCGECGSALTEQCAACGAVLDTDQNFCTGCGRPRNTASPEQAVDTPTRPDGAGELRLVSVLFCDLVGHTARSEHLDADVVRELLVGYFDVARAIVGRHGGTLDKFIGDAVMAVWGVPVALENDAERAVRAGLELVDAVEAYGDRLGIDGLQARVGVVTGRAAAMDQLAEGIVVGDRVNTAARIQSIAAPGTVLVDSTTRRCHDGGDRLQRWRGALLEGQGRARPGMASGTGDCRRPGHPSAGWAGGRARRARR